MNGTFSSANKALLTGLLREEGGFKGFVVSDWGATHGSARDAVKAGLDMEQPGDSIVIGGGIFGGPNGGQLLAAVQDGNVSLAELDAMVARILTPFYMLGQEKDFPPTNFYVQVPFTRLNQHVNVRSDAHTALIRQIGAAGIVMLKNQNGALPLRAPASLAVVGLDAAPPQQGCLMNACDGGTVVVGWGSGTTSLDHVISPVDAIKAFVSATPTALNISATDDRGLAVGASNTTEAAIVFVHAMSGEIGPGFTEVDSNFGDRKNLLLWNEGDALIKAVARIVVIHTVGPVDLEAWISHPNFNYSEGLLFDYRHFDAVGIAPRFAFGFGLSYTTFLVTFLATTGTSSPESVTCQVEVINTGQVDGSEVVQLYLGFPPEAGEPIRQLRGFERVQLKAGEATTVAMTLSEQDLRCVILL
ncbi:hypothetical protein RQP46_011266 [Phenoliferia psychrophenolica]